MGVFGVLEAFALGRITGCFWVYGLVWVKRIRGTYLYIYLPPHLFGARRIKHTIMGLLSPSIQRNHYNDDLFKVFDKDCFE